MKTQREKLAWAAGFVDGEGHFGFSLARKVCNCHGKCRRYGVLEFSVAQVDRRPLDRLRRTLGVGKVLGPYDNKPGRRPYFVFTVHRAEVFQTVVASLRPWLAPVKRAQAEAALRKYRRYSRRPVWKRGSQGCR